MTQTRHSLSQKAMIAVGCIDIEGAAKVTGARWEPFQLQFLNNSARFGIDSKARQIAWSFTAAMDAIIDSILRPGTPHLFVSINQIEAAEKIRYAHQILDAWHSPKGFPPRPEIVGGGSSYIEFANKSRLISYPCKPPRGPTRAAIYLDEMAHYTPRLAPAIYKGALPATVKGDGYIRVGSSPLGAGGMFWEIMTESLKTWPGYDGQRHYLPWWSVHYLCNDPAGAAKDAAQMLTQERVEKYGTDALWELFTNMFLDDFKQEFECLWVDESVAWITWKTIQDNQEAWGGKWVKSDGVDGCIKGIDKVQRLIRYGDIDPVLCGGIDIGRVHDLTEIVLLGKSITGHLPMRANFSMRNVEFDDQEMVIKKLLDTLPITRLLIDSNGIGAQLAENAEKHSPGKAVGVDFTSPNKELWAVEARLMMERTKIPLPLDKDIAYQVHSIKKVSSSGAHSSFDAERNKDGHADKAWALFLAIWAGKTFEKGGGLVLNFEE